MLSKTVRRRLIGMRYWCFAWYAAPTAALLVLAVSLVALWGGNERWKMISGIVAGTVSFVYFMQKQRLEELKLFQENFARFNGRYDELNEALNGIREADLSARLSPAERDTLYNYFNLCGEEYLLYDQGYIYPQVWQAWHNGMMIFRKNSRIRALWDHELYTAS